MVERNASLRPLQITGCRQSNHVYFPVDNFQSTFALKISKNHQSGVDMRISFLTVLLVFSLVRLLLVLRLFSLKLLDQESTLASGMLGIDNISLFILLDVNVTW